MNRKDGSQLIPARRRDASDWGSLMDAALLSPESANNGPTLAQSLTRLHYLDEAFIPPPEWEELLWLLQEARHHHAQREQKHWLLKWKPRRQRQEQVEHFLERGVIKGAAILRTLEERFLLMRGRLALETPESPLQTPPTWREVETQAQAFTKTPPDVWASAQFLNELAPSLNYLLESTDSLAESPDVRDAAKADFQHFTWHARETLVSAPNSPFRWWKRMRRAAGSNQLTFISLEKLASLLRSLRERLVRWDSGWRETL